MQEDKKKNKTADQDGYYSDDLDLNDDQLDLSFLDEEQKK